MRALLSAFAFRTEIYASAEEFILAAQKSEATCLLLDVQLGDITGIELTRHLLAGGVQIPTVYVSCSKDQAVRRHAMELGCVAFLEKPFAAHQLIEAVVTAAGSNPYFDK